MLAQPCGFSTRFVDAGLFARNFASRVGRRVKSPPQFGHLPFSTCVAQSAQNVHSNEQIIATDDDAGKSRSQHSQLGLISNICASHVRPIDEERHKPLERRTIFLVEARERRAVEIEHAVNATAFDQGHDKLRVRS